jgi:gliding motility-associated-like protein
VITGNDGCTSDTFVQKIVVGTDPFGRFGYLPQPYCEGDALTLIDSSGVEYGTVSFWNWVTPVGNFTTQNPNLPNGLPAGMQSVSLQVKTLEGCIASPWTRTIEVKPKPKVEFASNNACVGDPVNLVATNLSPALPINTWRWDLGDGRLDSSGSSLTTSYANGKDYTVGLIAKAVNGCSAPRVTHIISIYQTHAYAGADTTIATGQSLQLHATGGERYQWSPPSFLSDPTRADPLATPDADIRYILTAYTPVGCPSYDSINIRVFKGPEIYVPTGFTPNGDGLNDVLHVIPIGVTLDHFRVFNRWGQLVFETHDASKGWDGFVKGYLNPGNYAWDVAGRDYNGNLIRKTGLVTLIR